MKIKRITENPSPKGLGYDAHLERVDALMIGKDGKLWIVKEYNKKKRWVISDYYKEYKKSEKKLLKLMEKSIINFNYISYEDIIKREKNYFEEQYINKEDIHIPENNIEICIPSKIAFLVSHEFNRLCCLSGYYKYVINTGSDYFINNKKVEYGSYFYKLNIEGKEWKDYKKECKRYERESKEEVKRKMNIIEELEEKKKRYILKNYM